MTETATRPDEQLDEGRRQAILDLLLEGRRVSEVIAHGLTRRPGWRRPHVVNLVAAKGWSLDSDGRIPRRFRSQEIPPATRLPGAPPPEPPRRPVVEYPPEGTVTEGERAVPAFAVIAAGKQHDSAQIRRLAEKAETALRDLQEALKADERNAVIRNRLAQVEAEAERLRAQLGQKKRGRPKGARPSPGPVKTETLGKPIAHGTWGGYLAETKRGLPHCAACETAKDEQMIRLRGGGGKAGNDG